MNRATWHSEPSPLHNIIAVYDNKTSGYIASDGSETLVDGNEALYGQITPFGNLRVSETVRLLGGNFDGTTLDIFRWGSATGNGGSITVASGIGVMRTNGSSNAISQVGSVKKGRFLSSTSNNYLAGVRMGGSGVNNVMTWGAINSGFEIGLGFQQSGASFGVIRFNGTAGTTYVTGGFNGPYPLIQDSVFHLYEILYTAGTARFYQDRKLVHRITTTTDQIVPTMNLQIFNRNMNINGGTADLALHIRGQGLSRIGQNLSRPLFYHNNTQETKSLKLGAGSLHRVSINQKGATNASLVLYDNPTGAAGQIIANFDLANNFGLQELDVDFNEGLTIVVAGGNPGSNTIVFD